MSSPTELNAETIAHAIPLLVDGAEPLQQADGTMRVQSAILPRRGLQRWLAKLFRLPERISVDLDDIGSWVISHLDGRTLEQLAAALAHDWKLTRREAEVSITVFIRALLRRRLVRLEWAQGAPQ